jgi:hypothetical protein
VQREQEWLLIAKTRADALSSLTQRVLALHSYDVPEVIASLSWAVVRLIYVGSMGRSTVVDTLWTRSPRLPLDALQWQPGASHTDGRVNRTSEWPE